MSHNTKMVPHQMGLQSRVPPTFYNPHHPALMCTLFGIFGIFLGIAYFISALMLFHFFLSGCGPTRHFLLCHQSQEAIGKPDLQAIILLALHCAFAISRGAYWVASIHGIQAVIHFCRCSHRRWPWHARTS